MKQGKRLLILLGLVIAVSGCGKFKVVDDSKEIEVKQQPEYRDYVNIVKHENPVTGGDSAGFNAGAEKSLGTDLVTKMVKSDMPSINNYVYMYTCQTLDGSVDFYDGNEDGIWDMQVQVINADEPYAVRPIPDFYDVNGSAVFNMVEDVPMHTTTFEKNGGWYSCTTRDCSEETHDVLVEKLKNE